MARAKRVKSGSGDIHVVLQVLAGTVIVPCCPAPGHGYRTGLPCLGWQPVRSGHGYRTGLHLDGMNRGLFTDIKTRQRRKQELEKPSARRRGGGGNAVFPDLYGSRFSAQSQRYFEPGAMIVKRVWTVNARSGREIRPARRLLIPLIRVNRRPNEVCLAKKRPTPKLLVKGVAKPLPGKATNVTNILAIG